MHFHDLCNGCDKNQERVIIFLLLAKMLFRFRCLLRLREKCCKTFMFFLATSTDKKSVFFLQVTTRVFIVWAYHLVDDASDPHDFSMHSRRGHTSESYRLVYENIPTRTITGQDSLPIVTSSPGPSTPAPTTKTKRKSFGFKLGFSFLTISLASVFSILL